MTLDELIKKYDGKQLEVAGSANAKFQCVDLANAYIRDVLGLKIIEWTNAKDFPSKAGSNYEYIKNTPLGVPKRGDLIVWNGNVGGGNGHIAIFMKGGIMGFTSFDQNWSTKERCKVETHTYRNVAGWLRPRGDSTNPDWLIKNSDAWIAILTFLKITKKNPTFDDAKNVVAGIKARATAMEKEKGEWEAKYDASQDTISTKDDQLLIAEKARKACQGNLKESNKNLTEAQGKIEGMIEDNKKMGIELSNLKAKRGFDELVNVRIRKEEYAIIKYKGGR
ncbi:hypothetical protein LCGC14_2868880 [marine sediment metagenome]|uniref:Peptidase C51 domain-containing protein n=1 Tax=marine sediment metagenome TaxID=412755 RepID=A0A0F9AUR3_9ZZZZ